MLLALGPLLLDTTVRTIVVGMLDGSGPAPEAGVAGADAVWLRAPTAALVTSAGRHTGLPVGATVDDLESLDGLVAAGAVAVECDAPDAIELVRDRQLTLWCAPAQARRALDAGIAAERIVCEPGDAGTPALAGASVAGAGPGTWGQVVRAGLGGARVVRTTDVRSVRRVVTVMDRLAEARAASGRGVTS